MGLTQAALESKGRHPGHILSHSWRSRVISQSICRALRLLVNCHRNFVESGDPSGLEEQQGLLEAQQVQVAYA